MSTAGPRRADALKNRERLVAEADALFASDGGPVTLDMIAKAAGVGIGTLYRHFPTRESLVEAVYRLELDALDRRADALLATSTASDAMRHWLDDYLHFVATKHAMQDALRVGITPRDNAASTIRLRINAVVGRFLSAGGADGTLRDDVSPDDVTLGLLGMALAANAASQVDQTRRMLGLLLAGLKQH
ncbi:TetR/AcrR family transcriptional regulator [Sphingomonas sp. PAMC 26621]|uniref:TetR/AcrR family transcriptional regulator n=1 Tax=Sphingomonas sp. PAMC 26621 TaxID=1112213 RepID=UPI00028998F4|nr:TetR/AcrR family transcriptional regulator [Sphingomonas sp. PAMC 26621]